MSADVQRIAAESPAEVAHGRHAVVVNEQPASIVHFNGLGGGHNDD